MYWPWHHDQRAEDEADERAARQQDEADEADLLAMFEAHCEEDFT